MVPSKDDEYFLPEEQQIPAIFGKSSASSNKKNLLGLFEKITRKNIFMGLGVLVVLFLSYRVANALWNSSSSRALAPISTPTAVIEKPAKPMVQQPAAPLPTPTAPGDTPAALPLNNEAVARISKNEEGILQLQASVAALQEQMANMTSALQDITHQLQQKQEAAKAEKKAAVVKKKKRPASSGAAVSPEKRDRAASGYYVKAMIPGRAWLILPNHSTTTVIVGTHIPGYGKVTQIDFEKGIVATSSGRVLHADPDDR